MLKIIYVAVLTGVLPLIVVFAIADPVRIMSASGIVAAVHTPVIVALTLAVNRRQLPDPLRPGKWFSALMLFSAFFYAVLASCSFQN